MITVDGDSMEPLVSSDDRILIDVSRRVPVPSGIFVIWNGMGQVVKRIEHSAALRHAESRPQVSYPRVRQLRAPRRGGPRRRSRRLGPQAAVGGCWG